MYSAISFSLQINFVPDEMAFWRSGGALVSINVEQVRWDQVINGIDDRSWVRVAFAHRWYLVNRPC